MVGPQTHALRNLVERKLLIVSGKGGVGRTTVAALLGLAGAAQGKRTLVATTGLDDRLGWLFGRADLPDRAVEVRRRLFVQRLVPRTCIREYGALVIGSRRVANAVFDNRLVRRLIPAIPGLDDFAVLGKAWHEATRGDSYDLVVFDGPATGHLLLGLGVPRAIRKTVPGGPLVKEAELMCESLEDPNVSAAALVGLPETWPLTELGELAAGLDNDVGLHLGALFINGLLPDVRGWQGERSGPWAVVDNRVERARRQRESLAGFLRQGMGSEFRHVIEMRRRSEGVAGPRDLAALYEAVLSA